MKLHGTSRSTVEAHGSEPLGRAVPCTALGPSLKVLLEAAVPPVPPAPEGLREPGTAGRRPGLGPRRRLYLSETPKDKALPAARRTAAARGPFRPFRSGPAFFRSRPRGVVGLPCRKSAEGAAGRPV